MPDDPMTPHLLEYTRELGIEVMALIEKRLRADGFVTDDVTVPIVTITGLNVACAMISAAPAPFQIYLAEIAIKRIRDEFPNS